MATFFLLALIGYLVGSIPTSYLTMRLFTRTDIRTMGTGTASVSAVMVHGGKRPGVVALVAEMAKAGICIAIASALVGEVWASLVILTAAVIGCSWSVWIRGRGGQGQTIMSIGILILSPISLFIIAGTYLVPMALTRRHFLSNQIFHLSVPAVLWSMERSWEWALAGILFIVPFFIKQWLVGDDILQNKTGVKDTAAGAI